MLIGQVIIIFFSHYLDSVSLLNEMLEKWLHLHRKLRMTTIIFSHLVDFVHCYTIIALDSENLPLIGRVAGEVDNCQAMLISNIQLSD